MRKIPLVFHSTYLCELIQYVQLIYLCELQIEIYNLYIKNEITFLKNQINFKPSHVGILIRCGQNK